MSNDTRSFNMWAAMAAMVGMGGLYGLYCNLRPKRTFIEEIEVPEEDLVPIDENMAASERMAAQTALANMLEWFRESGIADYNKNREALAEKGVRSPDDVKTPNNPIMRLMYYQWAHGWRYAQHLDHLGLPPDTFGTTTPSQNYFAAIAYLKDRADANEKHMAQCDAIMSIMFDARANKITAEEAIAKIAPLFGL